MQSITNTKYSAHTRVSIIYLKNDTLLVYILIREIRFRCLAISGISHAQFDLILTGLDRTDLLRAESAGRRTEIRKGAATTRRIRVSCKIARAFASLFKKVQFCDIHVQVFSTRSPIPRSRSLSLSLSLLHLDCL